MPSELERAVTRYRQALDANEKQATRAITGAWQIARTNLVEQVETLRPLMASNPDPATIAQDARARALLAQVDQELTNLGHVAGMATDSATSNVVRQTGPALRDMALAGAGDDVASIAASWADVPVGAVQDLVGVTRPGSPVAGVLASYGPKGAAAAESALINGVAQGLGPRQVAQQIAKQADIALVRANALARTEMMRAARETARRTYAANAHLLRGWRWTCAKSSRTCLACLGLDGQVFKVDRRMQAHINCRCTLVPLLKGEKDPLEPASAWFARQSPDFQRMRLGKAYDAYVDGGVNLGSFVRRVDDPVWGGSYVEDGIGAAIKKGPVERLPGASAVDDVVRVADEGFPANGFATIDEAEAWASQKWKNVTFELDGLHIDAINPTLRQFDLLARDYPDVAARLKFVGTNGAKMPAEWRRYDDLLDRAVALADLRDGEFVLLNRSIYARSRVVSESLTTSAAKYTPEQRLVNDITHEFGHLVDGHIDQQLKGKAYAPVYLDADRGSGVMLRAYFEKHNKPTTELSRYATTNTEEGFAEAFAAIYNDPVKAELPYVKAVKTYIEETQNIRWYDDAIDFLDATPEQWRAAQEIMVGVEKRVAGGGP
jgi:SPP1 gp7 family putative phage head morphogenesis protein